MKDRTEAEDLLQEGFVKVFKNLNKYDSNIASLKVWMRRIFVNCCLDALRKHKTGFAIGKGKELNDIIYEIDNNLELELMSKFEMEKLYQIIGEIPPGYRTVFNLYVIEGYTHVEISKKLNISESTSKTQLFKARKKLKEIISNYFTNQTFDYANG